jgi:tRNA pseudouridine synthase 10
MILNLSSHPFPMNLQEKAAKILQRPVCDHCLGRQFAQLLHGYSNDERGNFLRTLVAMSIDKSKEKPNVDLSNFHNFSFHNLEEKPKRQQKCSVCDDLFGNLDKWVEKLVKSSKKYEFKKFLIGTRLTSDLIQKEEELWEEVGIDYCEPLKAEVNREIGKLLENKVKAIGDPKNADINFILDFKKNKVIVEVNPLFIYGEYQKLIRGIPQTKWPSKKYRKSVEEIIAKPFMKATKGRGHNLHGLGREDIDARCLAWRPFVLEILNPQYRRLKLNKISRKMMKGVKVRKLRLSSIKEVRKIKEMKVDKTYSMLIDCKKPLEKKDLKKIRNIVGGIKQKTPTRVLHRRADRYRVRKVKEIRYKYINKKRFSLTVKGEAGLYIKELVSGDSGRTRPSISFLLDNDCTCKNLDVVKIHLK